MKLLKKQISQKDGSGMVLLRPDTPEDLWHAYNLLQVGDHGDRVRCTTVRKVVKEGSTGSTTSQKKRIMLTVHVEKVDFDPLVLELRLSGVVTSENDYVRMGAHHTLTLEMYQNFSIEKDCWDQIYLDRLEEACHPERAAEIAAVVMQASGLAHVCVITGALTIVKARIEMNIPKKRTGSSAHGKAMTKFYETLYQTILRHIDFAQVKVLLLASPGFVKDDLFAYIQKESVRRDDRAYIENKSKIVLCKASSGHKHALEEVLSNPAIMSKITDTKVAKETQVLNKFMRMMDTDPDRAYYGFDHVKKAHEQYSAIESLLVTDELFRSSDIKQRKQYVQLVESVREAGGQTYILSSMHVSGQQLHQVSGVAAILRYPLPDLEDEISDDDENSEGMDAASDDDADEDYDPDQRLKDDMADMGLF